jgi:hypothetical protein
MTTLSRSLTVEVPYGKSEFLLERVLEELLGRNREWPLSCTEVVVADKRHLEVTTISEFVADESSAEDLITVRDRFVAVSKATFLVIRTCVEAWVNEYRRVELILADIQAHPPIGD